MIDGTVEGRYEVIVSAQKQTLHVARRNRANVSRPPSPRDRAFKGVFTLSKPSRAGRIDRNPNNQCPSIPDRSGRIFASQSVFESLTFHSSKRPPSSSPTLRVPPTLFGASARMSPRRCSRITTRSSHQLHPVASRHTRAYRHLAKDRARCVPDRGVKTGTRRALADNQRWRLTCNAPVSGA